MSNRIEKPLNLRQQRFVEEFIVDLNATQAYLRAGYAARNANVAKVNASRMLTNANIQAALQAARQRLSERTHVDQDTVIAGLHKEATSATSDGARVAAWGHLAKHFLPERGENKGRQDVVIHVVYENRPRTIDGTVIEERKAQALNGESGR